MNVARNLERSAYFFPARPALFEDGREIAYAELNERANRVATGLMAEGIKPGELVALCAPNSADWIAFYFGVLKAGATAVTLSAQLTGEEMSNLIVHARPRYVFSVGSRLSDLARLKDEGAVERIVCDGGDLDLDHLCAKGSPSFRAVGRDRSDVAAVLYTGGTTGIPKGVMLMHEGINYSAHAIAYYERSTENDRSPCFLPLNHVFGQMHIMNSTILSGGCLEIMPAFNMDAVLEAIAEKRITKFFGVPTIYVRFLAMPDLEQRVGRLRYCFSAAASLAMEIVKQWKERTGVTIAESYGMTETMPITFNHLYPSKHRVGSVGDPVDGTEVQIRDTSGNVMPDGQEGEICIRNRSVMKGYLNNPEGTAAAFWEGGWLRSGDIGVFDGDGYLFIVDRLKDLIITGGENVYPKEVEEQLYAYDGVSECAVIGVPDREWGERIVAFLVAKPGQSVEPARVREYLKGRLSPYKVPKEYHLEAELPKTGPGKILKRELKRRYQEEHK